MSAPTLTKVLLPTTLLAGAVFSTLTLPLVLLGSKPVDIRVNEEPVFVGQIKDVAAPYVSLVGLASLGVGIAGIAIAGWRQSSRKSEQISEQLSGLQQQLQEKEAQLEQALFSESRLQAVGLDAFLTDQPTAEVEPSAMLAQPIAVDVDAPALQPTTLATKRVHRKSTTAYSTAQATAPLAAAQAFLGYSRTTAPATSALSQSGQEPAVDASSSNTHLEELQEQIKHLLSQVETLQSSLKPELQYVAQQTH